MPEKFTPENTEGQAPQADDAPTVASPSQADDALAGGPSVARAGGAVSAPGPASPPAAPTNSPSIAQAVASIERRRVLGLFLIAAFAWALATLGIAFAMGTFSSPLRPAPPRVYRMTARLQILPPLSDRMGDDAAPGVYTGADDKDNLASPLTPQTQARVLSGALVRERAAQQLNMPLATFPVVEARAEAMGVEGGAVLVYADDVNAKRASDAVKATIAVYLRILKNAQNKAAERRIAALSKQIAALNQRIALLNRRIAALDKQIANARSDIAKNKASGTLHAERNADEENGYLSKHSAKNDSGIKKDSVREVKTLSRRRDALATEIHRAEPNGVSFSGETFLQTINPAATGGGQNTAAVSPRTALVRTALGSLIVALLCVASIFMFMNFRAKSQDSLTKASRLMGIRNLGEIPTLIADSGPEQGTLIADCAASSPAVGLYKRLAEATGLSGASDRSRPNRTVAVTSTEVGEGISTTVANLAIALSMEGLSVLVVDANLHDPCQHLLLGTRGGTSSPGLTDMLVGNVASPSDVARATRVENVRVIPAGSVTAGDPAALFGSRTMERFVKTVAPAMADVVLFDTPSVLSGEPGTLLLSKTSGILFVVDLGGTKMLRAQQAVKTLAGSGANILGGLFVRANGAVNVSIASGASAAPLGGNSSESDLSINHAASASRNFATTSAQASVAGVGASADEDDFDGDAVSDDEDQTAPLNATAMEAALRNADFTDVAGQTFEADANDDASSPSSPADEVETDAPYRNNVADETKSPRASYPTDPAFSAIADEEIELLPVPALAAPATSVDSVDHDVVPAATNEPEPEEAQTVAAPTASVAEESPVMSTTMPETNTDHAAMNGAATSPSVAPPSLDDAASQPLPSVSGAATPIAPPSLSDVPAPPSLADIAPPAPQVSAPQAQVAAPSFAPPVVTPAPIPPALAEVLDAPAPPALTKVPAPTAPLPPAFPPPAEQAPVAAAPAPEAASVPHFAPTTDAPVEAEPVAEVTQISSPVADSVPEAVVASQEEPVEEETVVAAPAPRVETAEEKPAPTLTPEPPVSQPEPAVAAAPVAPPQETVVSPMESPFPAFAPIIPPAPVTIPAPPAPVAFASFISTPPVAASGPPAASPVAKEEPLSASPMISAPSTVYNNEPDAPAAQPTPPAPPVAAARIKPEMTFEVLSPNQDTTTIRASAIPNVALPNFPRLVLEISALKSEVTSMRAGAPISGASEPAFSLETTSRREAPAAATMRVYVADAHGAPSDPNAVIFDASLQSPETVVIRSLSGQPGKPEVNVELRSDKDGGTRFRATIVGVNNGGDVVVEMNRTLESGDSAPAAFGASPLPRATQWKSAISLTV